VSPSFPDSLIFRGFRDGDEDAFFRLNEDWIVKYFDALEPADREIISHPKAYILDRGGHIFLVEQAGEAIGCCALIAMAPGEFELAKMTVAESARGAGVGRRLVHYAIEQARLLGARRLYLESNRKVAAAIHLYEDAGFRHLSGPDKPSKYVRANVFMELLL
jgi:putative acetyltransferase